MIPIADRLAAKTLKTSCGCHIWLGAESGKMGHGGIKDTVRGKVVSTHRIAYEIANGSIPHGMCVLHSCDVPACVNPDHLFLGTLQDNNADMVAKGRNAKGPRLSEAMRNSAIFKESRPRGSRNKEAKVTEAQVIEIRAIYKNGGKTQAQIGKEFGISEQAVSCIVRRETWAHVG